MKALQASVLTTDATAGPGKSIAAPVGVGAHTPALIVGEVTGMIVTAVSTPARA